MPLMPDSARRTAECFFGVLYRGSVQAAVARRRSNPLLKAAASFAQWYLDAINGTCGSIRFDGEEWLIGVVARTIGISVAFDVGANRGEWSAAVLRASPSAQVHAFEVVPELRVDLASEPVTVHEFGLGSEDGSAVFTFDPTAPGGGSSVRAKSSYSPSAVTVSALIRSGDGVAGQLGIDRIDLLKVDVEGAEGQVLRGFSRLISEARIAVIQFEYGNASGEAHFLMSDIHEFFAQHGYMIGKLFPDSIRIEPITAQDSEFRRSEGNWVAATPEVFKLIGVA